MSSMLKRKTTGRNMGNNIIIVDQSEGVGDMGLLISCKVSIAHSRLTHSIKIINFAMNVLEIKRA